MSKEELYFRRYLAVTPLSLALQRAAEAKAISSVKLKRPILDLGCGFGEFAEVFFEEPVEMGIDCDSKELATARCGSKYQKLLRADARNLPFKNESFASILSVSTFEHIDDVDGVFKEVYRVLEKGGVLVFTVVTDKWDKAICYGPLLKKLGFKRLGEFYTNMFNKVFKHKTLIGKSEWEKHLLNAGFKLDKSQEIVSSKVAFYFDFFLFSAWVAQALKLIAGKRIVFRPKFITDFLVKLFLKYVEEDKEGTNLFVIARKTVK